MNSRDLLRKTLTFDSPRRVPRDLWLLPWANKHYPDRVAQIQQRFPNDIAGAPVKLARPLVTRGDPYLVGEYTDEWGCTFFNIQEGVIGEVKNPLVRTWADLERVKPPLDAFSFDVELVNAFCRQSDKFVTGGCCPRPFERMQFLRGSYNLYLDLADPSPEFYELLERVHGFYLNELERWAQTEVDGLTFMDDWGSQRSLLISPAQWRKTFKPLYKDYIDLAHQSGKFILMHSDGYTFDIMGDLIELGLDALNSQLFCMDIEEIGRKFAGKLTFWGEIDRQHLLPYASTEEIAQAVQRVRQALYHQGGVIAQCEFGAGANPDNVEMVFQAWDNL